jgi:hypothetical protein
MKVARTVRKAPLREWEDDSEIVELVPAAELQKAKPPEIYKGTDELIAEFERLGKVDERGLLRELAIAKLAHLTFGEERPDVSIRFKLFDVIGSTLGGHLEWKHAQERAQEEWVRNEAQKKTGAASDRRSWAIGRAAELYRDGLGKKEVVHRLAVEEHEREKAAGKRKVRSVEAKELSFARIIPKPPK